MPNVILTPHIGGSTLEAQLNIGKDATAKLINYINKGMTVGSYTIPEINLPHQENTHRILHIHKNVPGIMSAINTKISALDINIERQYLNTKGNVGYAVLDVNDSASEQLFEEIKNIPHTIKARIIL